mmetsp:Transcript_15594/g.30174  ORF Transcript_15594/g.30174 Transcript_15594/m.30174 type:complete len:140 (-) Transcript_15594:747-1166(-)
MPRFYCDYCDMYLTHDSAHGRRQHRLGWKHRQNFGAFYEHIYAQEEAKKAQEVAQLQMQQQQNYMAMQQQQQMQMQMQMQSQMPPQDMDMQQMHGHYAGMPPFQGGPYGYASYNNQSNQHLAYSQQDYGQQQQQQQQQQ